MFTSKLLVCRLGVVLIGFFLGGNLYQTPSQAKQLSDGTTIFEKSPRLVDASTTFNNTYVWGATYYFTIALPENAGEPLQKVSIAQRQGSEDIRFDLEKTVAYEGTADDKGIRLAIATVDAKSTLNPQNEPTNTITVTFLEPVAPGKTLTVGLKPKRNPQYEGIYLFGVTVFPRGDKPSGLYLGVGRLHFYRYDNRFWRHW
jgi:hypothetical protein